MTKNMARLYIGEIVDDLQKCSDYITDIYCEIRYLDDSDPLRSELVDKLKDAFDIVDDLKNRLGLHKSEKELVLVG